MLQKHVSVVLTCLVRLNMGAGLVGQLCLAARREEGVCRPSTGSNRSKLNTGKPSYLMKNTHSHISERGHTVIYMHTKWVGIHQAGISSSSQGRTSSRRIVLSSIFVCLSKFKTNITRHLCTTFDFVIQKCHANKNMQTSQNETRTKYYIHHVHNY